MLRTFFSTLADEEVAACNWDGREPPELGSFGHAHDNFEDSVKPFYATWTSFATTKSFSWKDAYRYSEAPDRRVRRMMEKENKKRREEGIREFNDAVRSLVAFVKKRDPRYKLNRQSEAERQKVLREATSAQAARARAQNIANMQEHVVPAWSQVREEDPLDEESEGEQTPEESYECVVCIKTFKSEKQYEMHERSKKHLKNVAQIRRQMRSDNKALDLDSPGDIDISSLEMGDEEMIDEVEASTSPTKSAIDTFPRKPSMNEDRQSLSDNSEGIDDSDAEETNEPPTENGDSNIPEYKPKLAEADPPPHPHEEIISDSNDNETISNVTKLGKAKEKRMKKAAQQAAKSQGPEEVSFNLES
jgi:DnaJ family protein A protein 5